MCVSTLVVPQAMDTKDAGAREAIDQAFAVIVGAESAIVRSQVRLVLIYVSVISCLIYFAPSPSVFSGTHDIRCALFAFLDKPSQHKAIEPLIKSQSKTRLQPQPQIRRPAEVVEDSSHAQVVRSVLEI